MSATNSSGSGWVCGNWTDPLAVLYGARAFRNAAMPDALVMPRTTGPACVDKLVVQRLLDVLDELLIPIHNIQRLDIARRLLYAAAIALADRAGDIALEQRDDLRGRSCSEVRAVRKSAHFGSQRRSEVRALRDLAPSTAVTSTCSRRLPPNASAPRPATKQRLPRPPSPSAGVAATTSGSSSSWDVPLLTSRNDHRSKRPHPRHRR